MNLDVECITELWKRCSNKYLQQWLNHLFKKTEIYDRNWWWMVYGKINKGLPPLRIPKLSKNAQYNKDEIRKTIRIW